MGRYIKVKGIVEEDLALGSEHTMQFTDEILWYYMLETYLILLTNITLKKKVGGLYV